MAGMPIMQSRLIPTAETTKENMAIFLKSELEVEDGVEMLDYTDCWDIYKKYIVLRGNIMVDKCGDDCSSW